MNSTNQLTNSALAVLWLAGCHVWRSNQAPIPVIKQGKSVLRNGKQVFRRFTGEPGVPDIIGFAKYFRPQLMKEEFILQDDGTFRKHIFDEPHHVIVQECAFIAVEIKIGKDKLSLAQIEFRNKLVAAGGLWFECRDDTKGLEQYLKEKGLLK